MSIKLCNILLEAGIIFLIFFTPMALGTVLPWGIFVMRATVILLLGIWGLKMVIGERFDFRRTLLDIPLLIFLVIMLISVLFVSDYKRISWEYFSYFACGIAIFFVITNNIREEVQIRRITTAILIVGTIMGIYGILQFFNVISLTPRVTPLRVSSFYYNSNHYSGYLVMVLPIPISLFLYSKSLWKTLIFGVLSAILGINLALSYSWGEVAFLIALLFLFSLSLWALERRRVIVKSLVIGGLIVLISLGGMLIKGHQLPQDYLSQRLESLLDLSYGSIVGRIGTYKHSLKIIFDHPLSGTGLGTYPDVFPKYKGIERARGGFTNYAHNDYIQIASEMGITGLVSFLIVIVSILSIGFQSVSSSRGWIKAISVGILSGIMAILLHGFTDGNLTIIPSNILYFYLLSAILALGE